MFGLQEICQWILETLLKPVSRLAAGWIATPIMKLLLWLWGGGGFRNTEEAIHQWLRCSLVLSAGTYNFECLLFNAAPQQNWNSSVVMFRLIIVLGVMQQMTAHTLFAWRCRELPKLPRTGWRIDWERIPKYLLQLVLVKFCQGLSCASCACAILAAIYAGAAGWKYLAAAILLCLIVCLATTRIGSPTEDVSPEPTPRRPNCPPEK